MLARPVWSATILNPAMGIWSLRSILIRIVSPGEKFVITNVNVLPGRPESGVIAISGFPGPGGGDVGGRGAAPRELMVGSGCGRKGRYSDCPANIVVPA